MPNAVENQMFYDYFSVFILYVENMFTDIHGDSICSLLLSKLLNKTVTNKTNNNIINNNSILILNKITILLKMKLNNIAEFRMTLVRYLAETRKIKVVLIKICGKEM